jgi:hypothetical protein
MRVKELITAAQEVESDIEYSLWRAIKARLASILDQQVNPYTLIRALRLESLTRNKTNPSREFAFNFLAHNLTLILTINSSVEALNRLVTAFEIALEPANHDNQLISLLEEGKFIWDVRPYDPEIHGYSIQPRIDARGVKRDEGSPIKRLSGREIIRMYFEPSYLAQLLPKQKHYLNSRPFYTLESKKGLLLQQLLLHQGNWLDINHIIQATNLTREEVVSTITVICYDQRIPASWWIPLHTESYRPKNFDGQVTHYRLAPDQELSLAIQQTTKEE